MKIGSRVRLSVNVPGLHDQIGTVIMLCGDIVVVEWGKWYEQRHHHTSLIEIDEPFPYRSHRTMAEVPR